MGLCGVTPACRALSRARFFYTNEPAILLVMKELIYAILGFIALLMLNRFLS